jgi:hypothetical protein
MNTNELQVEQIDSLQNELAKLDESRLPEVLAGRLEAVEKVNKKFESAQMKKKEAQSQVDAALKKAEELIGRAEKLGELKPETHKFFKHEYSTKGDRITALEKCLEDLGNYSSEAAEYQQQLAKVQNAALESQTAVMEVQKCQMEYLECTSEALKFLYGLSAYGIASTQSIVTNLELVLSGAKKKELGEMAKQQMFLVIDQLKSQENLQLRMEKNEGLLDSLQEELKLQAEREEEYDERFRKGEEKDKKQDELLSKQIKKDAEHDKALAERAEKDEEHDKAIEAGIERDREQDQVIQEHTEKLANRVKKDEEQDRALSEMAQMDQKQNSELEAQREKHVEHDKAIGELEQKIAALHEENESIRAQISASASKGFVYAALGVGLISLILSIVSIFI